MITLSYTAFSVVTTCKLKLCILVCFLLSVVVEAVDVDSVDVEDDMKNGPLIVGSMNDISVGVTSVVDSISEDGEGSVMI